MKELLRENIDSCIKEFQEGACQSSKTLRVALEFCIRVNAIDHLFGELFLMFAEAGMEQRFFENLEPFILSGKFKQTKIPKKILNRLIEYYRQKDLELLEKILLNLNLSKYKDILEVRHICETEFLTSALIHILTNLFDNDNEVRRYSFSNLIILEHRLFATFMLTLQHDDKEHSQEREERYIQVVDIRLPICHTGDSSCS